MTVSLVLRADASMSMGHGHVMRLLALAEHADGPTVLRSHHLPAALAEVARRRGVRVQHAASVGDDVDAAETIRLAHDMDAAVVLDGYHFDSKFRRSVHERSMLCWVDDGGTTDRAHASLVVNQNLGATSDDYPGADARVLSGPLFAMLRPMFARMAASPAAVTEPPTPRVVVTFGGTDPARWSRSVLDELERDSGRPGPDVAIVLVIGSGNAERDELEARARALDVEVRHDVDAMADVLVDSTVVLAAAGTTTLELAALGRPSVLVSVAANQERVARHAARLGIATWSTGGPAEALRSVAELLADQDRRTGMRDRARVTVDGRGGARVVEAIQQA